jgi:hypothetical protein
MAMKFGKSGKTSTGKPALTGTANAMTRGNKNASASAALAKAAAKKKAK